MLNYVELAFAIFTLAVTDVSQAFVPPAGKCKDIAPEPIDLSPIMEYSIWQVLYVPASKEFSVLEADYEIVLNTTSPTVFSGFHIMKRNKSISPYTYAYSYEGDNLFYEDANADDGQKVRFKIYLLDIVPGEVSVLYYRCSDTGDADIDTRFITIPRGNTLSTEGEQRLLNKDRSYNFTTGIRKLVAPTL